MEILENLNPVLRSFWYIAIPTSLIFILQTALSFIGSETSGIPEFDSDIDASPESDSHFQYFSLRNLINFLIGFSWTGIAFYPVISFLPLLIIMSMGVGIGFVYLYFFLIKQLLKLTENNKFKIQSILFKNGEVYLTIPPNRTGKGKILISSNGAIHELEAMTDNEQEIPNNAQITVVDIEEGNILIVEEI